MSTYKQYVADSNRRRTGEKRSPESCKRISEALKNRYTGLEHLQLRYDHVMKNSSLVPSGCREWMMAVDKDGYPKVRGRASHIVLRIKTGEDSNGRHGLHSCNNPRCVLPEHLYWGSSSDNAKDRVKAGRQNPPPLPKYGKDNPAYGIGPPPRTSEERSRTAKTMWNKISPKKRSERFKNMWAEISPEERSRIANKGWSTRRSRQQSLH